MSEDIMGIVIPDLAECKGAAIIPNINHVQKDSRFSYLFCFIEFL